jgi:uncharacterized membrane protein
MRLHALLILTLLAAFVGPARADMSYSVFNVRPGDTLNMRTQPDPRAAVVQTIPHDAEGITLTGRMAQGAWAEATYRRKRGWINARFLGLGSPGRYQLPAYLDCSGTEPFWSIAVTPIQARADMMFAERRYGFRLTRAQSAMNRSDILLLRGVSRPGEMSLILRHEACSDGMSDTHYPYSAVALLSGLDMVAGCCRPAIPR